MTQHPIHWLYAQCVSAIPSGQAQCYLCGTSCTEQYPVAKGIADTFNSHFLCKVPSSSWLCAACQWYFDSKAGHPDFRKMSLIVAQGAWHNWQRAEMKTEIGLWVSHGLETDTYLVCSLSKKKHILLQAPLNAKGTKLLAIQVEERIAYVDQSTWQLMNRSFMRLLELGHNKGEILSGQLYGNTLRKHGQIKEAMSHSQMLDPYRNSAQLELLSYVTIVEKGEDIERDQPGSGDGSGIPGSLATQSSMESDRPRVQIQVQDGHLDASRDQRSSVRTDEQHVDEVSQQPLW